MPEEKNIGDVSLADKVAFLSRRTAHGIATAVETVETHMSWVFLTPEWVYKLKNPVASTAFDFTTLEGRRRNCLAEVELNRRLSEGVYQGMMALTRVGDALALGGEGEVVDWLVKMKRLPAESFLDVLMDRGRVPEPALAAALGKLARFYAGCEPEPLSPRDYCRGYGRSVERVREQLLRPHYGLDAARVQAVADAQAQFARRHSPLLAQRVRAGRVLEAHGDLRPQHLCLTEPPQIIDCLEFSRPLRIMDSLDELGFLALECEMAGHQPVARRVLEYYVDFARDAAQTPLLAFYQSYRAAMRALLVAGHLDDESPRNPEHWRRKAGEYLAMAERKTAVFRD